MLTRSGAFLSKEPSSLSAVEASRMAPDLRQAFTGVFRDRTGASESNADAWLRGLVASERYLGDIWTSAA